MEYKSQVGQDKWVAEFFNNKQNGFFLDIGAHDGISFSNTHYLEKALNWKGICVEPGKKLFKRLIAERNCICYNFAIQNEDKRVIFKEDSFSGKITTEGSYWIQGMTVKSLLGLCLQPRIIDYVSLDIEGGEYNALLGFPFDAYEVILWTIEHNSYSTGATEKEKIKSIMFKNGYELFKENVQSEGMPFEDWFINKKYAK